MTAHAEPRQPEVVTDQPVSAGQCPGAYRPAKVFATDGKAKCPECSGWYRVLKSGDLGPHKPRREARRRHRDARDIASMVRRMIDAHGRRVADGDEQDLRELVDLRFHLDVVIDSVVRQLHYEQEFSWAVIGEILGVTRQAARQRWGMGEAEG